MAKVPKQAAPTSRTAPAAHEEPLPTTRVRGETTFPHASDESRSQPAIDSDALASAMPVNENKPFEFGAEAARAPHAGATRTPPSPDVTASTGTEHTASDKTGDAAPLGARPAVGTLSSVRADATGRPLTSNQGVLVSDNQHSLKAGLRGPTLLEDFLLREKLTHFDHERIPERIVHARGSAAHGIFESYGDFSAITRAAPFAEAGKVTPVFTRFSTVAGERGSMDTARDARGFAVKFYTDEGNWDLVGNNIPVFFIQDAIKFPDLVHALKPEPHHGMPQAASAHDTFWDFVSLMPESTHMLMWVMSDRAIPRSYRMMQGFGVHSFRLVNADGASQFVKFHWTPAQGVHSLVWDEALKLGGTDPDFHRRDLWDAIEAGHFPSWELGFQLIPEDQADALSFDILDATKLVPEELFPITPVGRMTLDRNPDNFFAETEQVAFCTAHIIPGIDFSNDPLLGGRIHSYVDTQISRLGGPNFHEIPINAPISSVHNNQRDGLHRQTINRGRVAYEPNSLGGGCPYQSGAKGFVSFPQVAESEKLRGSPEKFAEHYHQARLFFDSQTPTEQSHIAAAFRFELSKVTVPAIRSRMLASLRNASEALAAAVADGLGMALPDPLPRATTTDVEPEVSVSPTLSLSAYPGDGSIRSRKVAILVADGVDAELVNAVRARLLSDGASPRLVGVRLGTVTGSDGEALMVDATMENTPAAAFDGLIIPDGEGVLEALAQDARLNDYVRDQYRHCKTLLAMPGARALLEACGISETLGAGTADPGVIVASDGTDADILDRFIAALALHKHFDRETDPPSV